VVVAVSSWEARKRDEVVVLLLLLLVEVGTVEKRSLLLLE